MRRPAPASEIDDATDHPRRWGWQRILSGGPRLAASYAAGAAAGFFGVPVGASLGGWLYRSGRVCGGSDALGCPVLLGFGLAAGVGLLVLALVGLALGLRGAWLLVSVAMASVVVQVTNFDLSSPWWLTTLLIPLVAALATDPAASVFGRRRRVAAVAVAAALLLWFAASIVQAVVG